MRVEAGVKNVPVSRLPRSPLVAERGVPGLVNSKWIITLIRRTPAWAGVRSSNNEVLMVYSVKPEIDCKILHSLGIIEFLDD